MKNTLTISIAFSFLTVVAFAQENKTKPIVSDAVVKANANSACDCMNKVDMKTLTTPQQKKGAMSRCIGQASKENGVIIEADKNNQTQKGNDDRKLYIEALGKKTLLLLDANCPAYKLLSK